MYLPNGHLLQNGKYKLGDIVGQGGFGITYKGIWFTEVKGSLGKLKTEVPVCVKEYFFKDYCLRDTDTFAVKVHSETGQMLFCKFKEKLISEARILSDVHHPYIVNVLEVFEENNTAYIVMEYIAGFSLKQLLEEKSILTENHALKYIRQVGEALQFVHEKNILHLDIKPSNILIDLKDNARLIDFGVSKRYDIEQQETSTTILALSKGFASIEQYDDEGMLNFSPCPDVYSLGATMYNLLTGKLPIESILRATKELIEPIELNPLISQKTNTTILKAMQVVPADRLQTVGEMLNLLDISVPEVNKEEPKEQVRAEESGDAILISRSGSTYSTTTSQDTTMLNQLDSVLHPSPQKRKRVLVTAIIGIAVVLASASVFYVQQGELTDETGQTPVLLTDTDSLTAITETGIVPEENLNPVRNNLEQSTVANTQHTIKESEATRQPEAVVRQTPQNQASQADASILVADQASIDSIYTTLKESGRMKLSQADFSGAVIEFEEARDTKLTEEIVHLIINAKELLEQQQVKDRRALYEEKMPLGTYVIVRKRSNGKYGAIDTKGHEVIQCKYLIPSRADSGRAFLREDNLYDIYDENAKLISGSVANY